MLVEGRLGVNQSRAVGCSIVPPVFLTLVKNLCWTPSLFHLVPKIDCYIQYEPPFDEKLKLICSGLAILVTTF